MRPAIDLPSQRHDAAPRIASFKTFVTDDELWDPGRNDVLAIIYCAAVIMERWRARHGRFRPNNLE